MKLKTIVLACALGAALLFGSWSTLSHKTRATTEQPTSATTTAASRAPVHIPGADTTPTATSTTILDSDQAPATPRPTGPRPTLWAAPSAAPSPSPATEQTITTTTARGLPTPTPPGTTPEATATAFAQAFTTLDTAVDTTPAAGPARAAHLALPALSKTLTTTSSASKPGEQWWTLVEHQGWTHATATVTTLGDAPADTADTAFRTVQVRVDSYGEANWKVSQEQLLVLQLRATSGRWLVSAYQVQSA